MDNDGLQSGAPAFQDATTLATELQARGYLTALVGKYMNDYLAKGPLYVPPGWDEWRAFKEGGAGSPFIAQYYNYTLVERPFGRVAAESTYGNVEAAYSTRVIRRKAIDFIGRAPATQPIFLLVTPYAPHTAVQVLSGTVGSCNAYPLAHRPSVNEVDVTDKPAYVQAQTSLTSAQLTNILNTRRKQCESLQTVDRMVADIISTLRTRGRLANTLFVFTSDNGLLAGEHRLRNRKHSAYLEATTVPLVIRFPGGAMGARDTNLVHMTDLTATLRDAAGVPAPFGAHGRSLIPLLTSPNAPFADDVLIEHTVLSPAREHFTALRTHTHLYVEYPWGSTSGGPFTELYDLVADPFQLNNLAADPAQASALVNLAARLAIRRALS
jgi:arylsulfatase A-like enzyme